ncbi:MAG: hypothetical protein JXR37_16825 [Kiritimatiellae bacterium]|nr:hypothetical protein [Kiritimatiellia bacterium]
MKHDSTEKFSSNAVRLSCKEWLVALLLLVLLLAAIPRMWARWEAFAPDVSFRMPYELSEDYWLYARWTRQAARRYPVLMLGDSVVWGEYVAATNTLPRCFSRCARRDAFVNIGVNGLHPAAANGLVTHYARAVRNKAVIINFNPLWLHARNVDLTGEAEFRFQHPGLVPQFRPRIPCYKATWRERADRVAARRLSLLGFLNHVKVLYQDNLDLKAWIAEHPLKNPYAARDALARHMEENARPHSRPVPWTKRRMKVQNYPWVPLADSFQWQSFRATLATLRARRNRVFVLLGPFNPYMMEEESRTKYHALRAEIEAWLHEAGIACFRVPDLPSDVFTDASHTTAEGYAQIADALFAHEPFRQWLAAEGIPTANPQP